MKTDDVVKILTTGGLAVVLLAPVSPVEAYRCEPLVPADYRCDPFAQGDPRRPEHPVEMHRTVNGSTSAVTITQAPPSGDRSVPLVGQAMTMGMGSLSPG